MIRPNNAHRLIFSLKKRKFASIITKGGINAKIAHEIGRDKFDSPGGKTITTTD